MQPAFWTTDQLRAAGYSKRRIAGDVASGRLTPVRRGHYARPDAPPEIVRAVRVGGVATSITAAREWGLWVPPDIRLHVAVPLTGGRLQDPDGAGRLERPDVCVHWTSKARGTLGSRTGTVPTLLVHEHVLACIRPEWAVAVLDSALNRRVVRRDALTALAARLPAHLAAVARSADGRAESGVEWIARYLLVLLGLRVEVQVVIDGVGRVDLLVDGRLIIELDGRAWHDDPAAFARDRRRDAAAVIGRYRVLRFDYRQVLFEWPTVEAAVLAALAA